MVSSSVEGMMEWMGGKKLRFEQNEHEQCDSGAPDMTQLFAAAALSLTPIKNTQILIASGRPKAQDSGT